VKKNVKAASPNTHKNSIFFFPN